jgi:hypothetical protein
VIDAVGTGNLMEKIAVASAVLPFASVASATSVYSPSSNASAGVYVNSLPLTSATTTSPLRVRLSDTGVTAYFCCDYCTVEGET